MVCCNFDKKFDVPNNLIKEYNHWNILIRKSHTKLGACVVMTKRHIERFSDATEEEMIEFGQVVKDLENALKKSFNYMQINWLMLMMKDKHVHFHVLPRYDTPIDFAERKWEDLGGTNPLIQKLEEPIPQEILDKIKAEILKNIL